MRKVDKALILFIGVGMLLTYLKSTFFKTKANEIIVAGHHVNKHPCEATMNFFFEKAVDSSRICDCLIPKFYPFVQKDPAKVKEYEEAGMIAIQEKDRDTAARMYRDCV